MKRSEMVCRTCLCFENGWCRLTPNPLWLLRIEWTPEDGWSGMSFGTEHPTVPDRHWCGSGKWPYDDSNCQTFLGWGEWEDND